MQLPIGAENDFAGVVDLIRMKAYVWNDVSGDMGAHYDTTDIPADLQDKAEQYRAELIDQVAESDEELLEKYLESGELTEDEIRSGIRKLTINREAYRCSAAPPSRTRVCSRCWTPSSTTCRARRTFRPSSVRSEGRIHRDRS